MHDEAAFTDRRGAVRLVRLIGPVLPLRRDEVVDLLEEVAGERVGVGFVEPVTDRAAGPRRPVPVRGQARADRPPVVEDREGERAAVVEGDARDPDEVHRAALPMAVGAEVPLGVPATAGDPEVVELRHAEGAVEPLTEADEARALRGSSRSGAT